MFHVILFQPEIPPNTGNIIRLCANVGAHLHLIEPLGFAINDKHLRRAGLDYHEWVNLKIYPNLADCIEQVQPSRLFACSTKGQTVYSDVTYRAHDALLFGPETRGLPTDLLQQMPEEQILRIPMQPKIRSLNLSNSVAVILYEAWRQFGFSM
jgi:tRNA (cytidine/uridine-2'-O-)-methyltransferase